MAEKLLRNNTDSRDFDIAVELFEQYETAVLNSTNFNEDLELISDTQSMCLATITILVNNEENDEHFAALVHIRNDLLSQIDETKFREEQITVNDLTITRIGNSNSLPLPNFSQLFPRNLGETTGKTYKLIDTNKERNDQLQKSIENTLILPDSVGLCDIAGLKREINLLKEAIVFPIQFPQLFTGSRKKWSKALLYGPPGTGKTQLAHCLAAEIQALFYIVSISDLLSRYVGESEKLIKTLFQHCQNNQQHCLIFIDEIDGLCRTRSSQETEFERRMKTELLNQLSAMDRNQNNKIFFLACTNCPWDLDPAFIRRFQRRIYIPLPDRETRSEILKLQIKSNSLLFDSKWDKIIEFTEGWSGSDLTDLVNCAMYQPLKELQSSSHWVLTSDNKYMPVKKKGYQTFEKRLEDLPANKITVRPVEISDFFIALRNITKTISNESVAKFEQFNKTFGTLSHALQDLKI